MTWNDIAKGIAIGTAIAGLALFLSWADSAGADDQGVSLSRLVERRDQLVQQLQQASQQRAQLQQQLTAAEQAITRIQGALLVLNELQTPVASVEPTATATAPPEPTNPAGTLTPTAVNTPTDQGRAAE